jgi:tRNA dimethylallyltransferase
VARQRGDVEILSADSMSVYRELDLATAKPSATDRAAVPHHLVDLVDPAEEFSVAQYKAAAGDVLALVAARGNRALIVGGTGLYVRAVVDDLALPGRWPAVRRELEDEAATPDGLARLHGRLAALDPLAASRTTPTNGRRVVRALEVTLGSGRPFSSFGPGLETYPASPFTLLGIRVDQVEVDRRIAERFESWMGAGLLAEARRLAERPAGLSKTARQALGYKELFAHLAGRISLEEAVAEAIRRTRSFARRQWSWFRRDPRIDWTTDPERSVKALDAALGPR